jgi:hypothetical protein
MKAYLVNFDLMIRVIAETEDLAVTEAINEVKSNINEYISEDYIPEVIEDKECPYSEKDIS